MVVIFTEFSMWCWRSHKNLTAVLRLCPKINWFFFCLIHKCLRDSACCCCCCNVMFKHYNSLVMVYMSSRWKDLISPEVDIVKEKVRSSSFSSIDWSSQKSTVLLRSQEFKKKSELNFPNIGLPKVYHIIFCI